MPESLDEGRGELLGRHVIRHWKRHPQLAIALQQPLGPYEREADDVALGVKAHAMPFRRLVEVDRVGGIADMEIETSPPAS